MVVTSLLSASVFNTYPCAPAASAALRTSASLSRVRNTILDRGKIRRISSAASRPFMTDIPMSRSTRSRHSSAALRTAWKPSQASPTICHSGCFSNISRTRARHWAASSTIRTDTTGNELRGSSANLHQGHRHLRTLRRRCGTPNCVTCTCGCRRLSRAPKDAAFLSGFSLPQNIFCQAGPHLRRLLGSLPQHSGTRALRALRPLRFVLGQGVKKETGFCKAVLVR